MCIVNAQQMRPTSLFGRKMMNEGSCDAKSSVVFRSANDTSAILLHGLKIVSIARMLEVVHARCCDSIAKSSSASGIDTVEHICTQSYRDQNVFCEANAHNISWLVWRKLICASVNDFTVRRLRFSSAQTTYGDARCIASDHFLAAFPSEIEVEAALYDAE